MVKADARALKDEASPPRSVDVIEVTSTPVLCRNKRNFEPVNVQLLPPRHFNDAVYASALEPGAESLRYDVNGIGAKTLECGCVHVITVVVRDQHEINFWQCRPIQSG